MNVKIFGIYFLKTSKKNAIHDDAMGIFFILQNRKFRNILLVSIDTKI